MRIVDLFSGAGGLTFGFYYNLINERFVRNADCEIVFANEFDVNAAKAFALNFPDVNIINKDIRYLTEEEILEATAREEIDIVIGGPPCQSFSTIGKRKYDDKARLYNEYLRVLSVIQPRMFLFENVKGMLSMRNENGILVINDIQQRFAHINDNLGYRVFYQVLDATNYGVPQHRERVFIIGIRNGEDLEYQFPEGRLLGSPDDYLSVKQAISDLPLVQPGKSASRHRRKPQNAYQVLMRGSCIELTDHFAGLHGDKIQTVINHVIQGEGRLYINGLVDTGELDEKYRLTSGYKNTYGRLIENQPCPTITNNMSTPSGLRCIHYQYNRALTPREGARIQSFPDWFKFCGTKTDIVTQIGNAVPPLLAIALASSIQQAME